MKRSRIKTAFILIVLAIPSVRGAARAGASIDASGSWPLSISSADLQSGAGSDLVPSFISSPSQVTLTISGTASPSSSWRVDVQESDIAWPGGVTLSVLRTSDGSGPGIISGGCAFKPVSGIPSPILYGQGDRSSIFLQLQLSGASIKTSPSNYLTSLIFTVVDL